MDGIYRHQRYIYDLTRKFFLLGRDHLLDDLRPPAGGTVLEVGCGTGRNLILTARQYPDAELYGFDISRMMLETAEQNIKRVGFSERIRVAEGDAADFSAKSIFGAPYFDRVFISYAVSMIPPWRTAISQAYAAVRPGGSLHIVDFGQQEELPAWFKRGLEAWLGKFSVTPRGDLEEEMKKVARAEGGELIFNRLYRDYAHYGVLKKPAQ
jgi:S-adenosylmethionine-diacylgycerolhomoserine-N-methlytransferase